jgi:hypothetical protein
MHAHSLERIHQLPRTVLGRFFIGVSHNDQQYSCSPADRRTTRLNLLRVLVANVFLAAAATASGGQRNKPALSTIMAAALQVASNQVLLFRVLREDYFVRDPLRHSPTLAR